MLVSTLAIDVAVVRLALGRTQIAADAATLAAASVMGSKNESNTTNMGIAVAAINSGGEALALRDENLEWGTWDNADQTFTPSSFSKADAVRITVTMDVPLAFGTISGMSSVTSTTTSVAWSGASSADSGCGFFSAGDTTINGKVDIDAYDSTLGSYGAGNEGEIGGACSNGTLSVNGGSGDLYANIYAGPGEDLNISGHPNFYGETGNLDETLSFPWVDCEDVEYPPGSGFFHDFTDPGVADGESGGAGHGGDLSISGHKTKTLGNSGTLIDGNADWPDVYAVFLKNIQTSGQAEVLVPQPTVVCVDGSVQLSGGGALNSEEDPYTFTLLATNSLQISGKTDFYGTAISNNSVQISGNADIYGLIAGENGAQYSGTVDMHMDMGLPGHWGLAFEVQGIPQLVL